MITATFDIDSGRLVQWLQRLSARSVHRTRQRFVETLAQKTVEATIRLNPVDTARARSSWANSLSRLGGRHPANWQGPHPEPEAISQGAREGAVEIRDTTSTTETTVVNSVPYVIYLERGTRHFAAFQMAHLGLEETALRIPELFRPIFRQEMQ